MLSLLLRPLNSSLMLVPKHSFPLFCLLNLSWNDIGMFREGRARSLMTSWGAELLHFRFSRNFIKSIDQFGGWWRKTTSKLSAQIFNFNAYRFRQCLAINSNWVKGRKRSNFENLQICELCDNRKLRKHFHQQHHEEEKKVAESSTRSFN